MKAKLSTGVKPRDSFAFASDTKWVRVKMNELTGNNMLSYGSDSGGAFSDSDLIQGTLTAIWNTTVGAFDTNGDNATLITHDCGEICRLDNLDGTIMFHYKYGGNTAGTSGASYGFTYRNPTAGNGWNIQINNNLLPQIKLTQDGTNHTVSGSAGSAYTDIADEIEGITGLIYRSGGTGNQTITMYGKGELIATKADDAKEIDETSGNLWIHGRGTDGGAAAAHTPSGVLTGDVIVIRTSKDLRSHAQRIANDWDNNQWEQSKVLADLGV